MKKLRLFTAILLSLLSVCLIPVYSQEKLVIAASGLDVPPAIIASKLLPEVYKMIGYDIEVQALPPMRAFAMVDSSEADGYVFGGDTILNNHPTWVKVNTPIGYLDIVVFTKTVNFKVNGWDSLKPYTVGYMYGVVSVEEKIKSMKLKIDGSQGPDNAFAKLNAGRIDVVVMPKMFYDLFKKKYPEIKYMSPPLMKEPIYTFVSKKRANLAPKLAAALSKLRKNGRIKEITDQVEADLQK